MSLERADLRADDALGLPFWEGSWWCWNPVVRRRLREAVRRAAAGDVIRYEETVRGKGGRLTRIDLTLLPLLEAGVVTALLSSAMDVGEAGGPLPDMYQRARDAAAIEAMTTPEPGSRSPGWSDLGATYEAARPPLVPPPRVPS